MCAPWVYFPSAAAAAAKVGQSSPEHKPEHSLASHLCSVSTAQNLNPLFSLKTGIQYANAACRSAHTAHIILQFWQLLGPLEFEREREREREREGERERCFISSACKSIERDASLSHGPSISWYKGTGPLFAFRPDLQRCPHQYPAAREHKTYLPQSLGSRHPHGSPLKEINCVLYGQFQMQGYALLNPILL